MLTSNLDEGRFSNIADNGHIGYTKIEEDAIEWLDLIDSGGQGSVWKALWKKPSRDAPREVAIKVAQHYKPELKVLQRVRHKHIVRFYGAIEPGSIGPGSPLSTYGIVMELAEHGSLFKVIREEQLQFEQILLFSRHIAKGLEYLHNGMEEKIIHRDLKSKNVLITKHRIAKICDFGSSKVVDPTQSHMTPRQGTPSWMAPEVIRQVANITEKCDTYSFGFLLWEMITGEIPWRKLEPVQIYMQVAHHKRRPPIPEECPERFANLIKSCWQGEPEERPSVEQIQITLNGMLSDCPLTEQVDKFIAMKDQWMKVVEEEMEKLQNKMDEVEEAGERRASEMLEIWEKFMGINKLPSADDNDIEHWDATHVAVWLSNEIKLKEDERYLLDILVNGKIDGQRFLRLTITDLENLGVKEYGLRKSVVEAIESLKVALKKEKNFPPLARTATPHRQRAVSGPGTHFRLLIRLANHYYPDATPGPSWNIALYPSGDGIVLRSIKLVEFRFSSSDVIRRKAFPDTPFIMPALRTEPPKDDVEVLVTFRDNVLKPKSWKTSFPVVLERGGNFTEEEIEVCIVEPVPEAPSLQLSSIGSTIGTKEIRQDIGVWGKGPPSIFSTPAPYSPHQSPLPGRRASVNQAKLNHSVSTPAKVIQHRRLSSSPLAFNRSSLTGPGGGETGSHDRTPIHDRHNPRFTSFGSGSPVFGADTSISSIQFHSISSPSSTTTTARPSVVTNAWGDGGAAAGAPSFAEILSVDPPPRPRTPPPAQQNRPNNSDLTPTRQNNQNNRSDRGRSRRGHSFREDKFKPFHNHK